MTLSFITRKNQLSVSSVLRQRLKLKMIPLGNGPLDNRVKGQGSAKRKARSSIVFRAKLSKIS